MTVSTLAWRSQKKCRSRYPSLNLILPGFRIVRRSKAPRLRVDSSIHLHYVVVFIFAVTFTQILCMAVQKDSNAVVTCFQAVEALGCDCGAYLDLEFDLEEDDEDVWELNPWTCTEESALIFRKADLALSHCLIVCW